MNTMLVLVILCLIISCIIDRNCVGNNREKNIEIFELLNVRRFNEEIDYKMVNGLIIDFCYIKL